MLSLALVLAFVAPLALTHRSSADELDRLAAQIAALEAQIDEYNAEAAKYSQQASSLQATLNKLTNEKNSIQAQINLSQTKYDKLSAEIKDTEQQIQDNRDALGDTLADLYVDGDITPLEMIASSDNIGDFLDKQEYRSSIRDTLVSTIDEIKTLKAELEQKKEEVAQVLADQKAQRDQLAAKESEQAQLVAQTRGQQAAFEELSSAALADKKEKEAQQQQIIRDRLLAQGGTGAIIAGDPNQGGYPYGGANYWAYVPDPWGMYMKQCVSYTAWKVYQKNGYMPYWGGVGNANQWPGNADRAGIARGSTPRVGSVGVIMAGAVGHVAWVEGVNGDGTVNVSQYNYDFGSGPGMYSEMRVSASTFDTYIYF